ECPKDILKELLSADEVYTEYPFCYRRGKQLINGIIDVLYNKDGQWYIVDYKTNADPDDLDLKYRSQLEAYKEALEKIAGIKAKALIYHLDVH
ncbi:MAG: PD-(D/E)XK nuclease family protein, partial [Erysipelotrichaceae bacterium]|nr:PD-(D/E)XK nuclease family protein [Erysipelotrichaceae bacterium]